MITGIDRILFDVPDLAAAGVACSAVLGVSAGNAQAGVLCFGLRNTLLELHQGDPGEPARVSGLVFADPDAGADRSAISNLRGLALSTINPLESAEFRLAHPQSCTRDLAVDHVVLRTADAADCINLFAEQLGIRLALDQTVEKWGGRMLFFRTGKMTLEVIELSKEQLQQDYFWGIAYQCIDIDSYVLELAARQVGVSAVREGRKPGTRVASLKSADFAVPTLLIQPTS